MTWEYAGYGEAGSGITGRIVNKPGIPKGGKIVIVSDCNRIRPRAHMHRYKLHKKYDDWTLSSQCEVRNIIEQLRPRIKVVQTKCGTPFFSKLSHPANMIILCSKYGKSYDFVLIFSTLVLGNKTYRIFVLQWNLIDR